MSIEVMWDVVWFCPGGFTCTCVANLPSNMFEVAVTIRDLMLAGF